jgi:phosphocarrier protein
MQRLQLSITNEIGLHARPASVFVSEANAFESDIRIRNLTTGSDEADAKSILSVLALGVEQGHEIEIIIKGTDEAEAASVLEELVSNGFAGRV